MQKKVYYCDYCGKRITFKNTVKPIRTCWSVTKMLIVPFAFESTTIGGDGCRECYESYKEWIKSRKHSHNNN